MKLRSSGILVKIPFFNVRQHIYQNDFISIFTNLLKDGSCNGLQHYAALGRDASGAESVNLAPNDVPKDVYSDIVLLVERERKRDAEEDGKDAAIAKILEGFVERKVILIQFSCVCLCETEALNVYSTCKVGTGNINIKSFLLYDKILLCQVISNVK